MYVCVWGGGGVCGGGVLGSGAFYHAHVIISLCAKCWFALYITINPYSMRTFETILPVKRLHLPQGKMYVGLKFCLIS